VSDPTAVSSVTWSVVPDGIVTSLNAALGGAALLWGLARTRRGALAGAIALGVLLAAGGGPVPVVNGGRAIGLWGGFFVLEAVGGAILALLYARLVAPVLPIVGPVVNAAGSGQGPAA